MKGERERVINCVFVGLSTVSEPKNNKKSNLGTGAGEFTSLTLSLSLELTIVLGLGVFFTAKVTQ